MYTLQKGVQQGSNLRLLLFNFVINHLLTCFTGPVLAYADYVNIHTCITVIQQRRHLVAVTFNRTCYLVYLHLTA